MVNMASKFLSNDQQNFTRMGVACVDEIKLVLKDILETQIAPKDLYNRICLCPELTNGSQRLRPDQKKLCFLSPPSVPDYVKFDVSLLYTLIRNLCQSLKPPQGWGKTPTPTDVQIGDDIERLRLFRNEKFGHLSSSDISDDKFSAQWKELEIIIKRAQTFVMSQGRAVNYEEKLAFIKRSEFGFEDMDKYKILLEGFLQLFKQTEDFPDIKIRGKNRILCGDKACFEAEIGNCQESTCLRFTWQKLKGNTTEQIDINSEKFKGSTYSQLVLQRVLKEDEGEYQAAVLREVNGRSLVIPSNKIYLQVFGDPPRVEILQISSETEYIAIHYSCAEDVLPSIDQIRWMKNGELLRLNSAKYNGGGIEDKYLKIFSPTEEDGGEYICTVSNALESVSKSIQLGVPMAQLPEGLQSPFGRQVIIEPIIKSCPPVKTVVWQISEDQNSENFKAIDVTYRRYFGSTLHPQKPVLVIPKVSYEDRMYYRIQVSNGIGNSWSNATLLKIDGDIPSVFLNHETNFLEKKVSLLCNVVLTENSPKVAEVLWTKDKKPLDISGCGAKYSGGTVSDPTLIINGVNSNDSGEYQCNVSNAVGNMSSCPLCLAPPCIDVHIPRLENDEEGEKLVCTCTVRSIPEAKAVEWSIQQRPEDDFKTIDVHEPTYIGSTVSLPYPVLIVHKYKPTSPQIFHIKVTNFIGETTTSIQGKPHKTKDTFLGSEEVDSPMDFYRKGGLKVMFAILIHDLSELFPGDKLKSFKYLLSELVEKDTDTVIKAESIREILQVLRQKNMFCPKDVLFLQCLLRKIGCVELCNKCSNYAKRCKALCFFENQPENGYKHVSFHVGGNVEDYSKEDLLHIQNIVADMLDCSTEFVYIDGLRPSESFVVVVAIKQKYISKLLAQAHKILERLNDLNVDYLVCDGVKIFRQGISAVLKVPARKIDAFGNAIKILMIETEDCMKETQLYYKIDDKSIVNPPSAKGSDQYTHWLENDVLKALAKLSDPYRSRSLHTARECLQIYNEGLIINSLARAIDSLNFISQQFKELPEPSENATPLEDHIRNLFENKKADLKTYATDIKESEENPLLLKLKDIIVNTYQKDPESRGIIFVRRRVLADILTCWINETEQSIRAIKYIGSPTQGTVEGMTELKQIETLKLLKEGVFNLMVATSISEDGLDLKGCNLVVRYSYTGTISHTTAKGRAENSRFYVLASTEKCVAEREWNKKLPDPASGQSYAFSNNIPFNDPDEENEETRQKKIYSEPDIEAGFSRDFDEILSSEKIEDPLKVPKDTTNTNKSSPADIYDPARPPINENVLHTTPNENILHTKKGNQEVDESETKRKGAEQGTPQSLENDDVSIKTLKLRQYQLEQAEKPIKGENCLIVSPTGSGKTYVAIRIIQHHLEEPGKAKKIVFIVDKINLANQQSEKIKDYVQCRLKVIPGDTQREEDFQDMKSLLPQYDVFVVTAQMLVNALTNQGVSIRCFSLLIFDECHHCHGSHPFKQIMNQYIDVKLEQTEEEKQLPQVVGFTASVGVGKAKTIEKATGYLKQVMSNMDAHYLVTVQKHRSDLARHVNSPEQFIKEVPVRTKDEFGVRVKSLMATTEKYLKETGVALVDRNAIKPPSLKGNEQYTQWLEDILLKALAKLSKSEATRSLFTIRKYLEIYNNALVHHSYARATDALNRIKTDIDNLPKSFRNENEIERKIKALFEGEYTELQACALDHERTAENPVMLKLKEIILTTHAEEPDMRGIVFVRTRILADILVSWMDNSKELQHIKARKYTCAQAQTVEGGMTKYEQVNAIELFKDGHFKIIVATTFAEEGLDIRECNLVVRYDYAGNPVSLVQARGRGRAENSRFYVLASAEKCVADREWINTLKEPMMEEAMKKVQQQIHSNHDAFLLQQQEFQEHTKKERDAAKHNNNRKVVETGQYCLRCLKCNAFLCMSSELRKILNAHHTSISEDFKNSIIGKKYTKAVFCGEDIELGVGQISCKECLVKLGTIALFKDVFFPILSITALKIEDDLERGDTLKKWKFVERYFRVPELTTEDLENVAKFGKLIEF